MAAKVKEAKAAKTKGKPKVLYSATGRRKESVACVQIYPGKGNYNINGKSLQEYFGREVLCKMVEQPLVVAGLVGKFDVAANILGGGLSGQAGALRHGIARALLEVNENLRDELKKAGLLTRDPRMKERKKYGLKKARKRPQFSKR